MQPDLLPLEHSENTVLFQVTDTHLYGNTDGALLGVRTLDSFHAVVDSIVESNLNCDAILATGDISQDHSTLSYQRFADGISAINSPCYWLPGNHDYKPSMGAVLPSEQIKPSTHVLLGDNWQMILLDSQVEGVPYGELSQWQLDQLDEQLSQYPERHTLVLLHHHPLPANSAWLDHHQLHNKDELWSVLAKHNNVNAILCGHIHQALDIEMNGVRVMATPSTCVQFLPNSNDFAVDQQAPGWRRLELLATGKIKSDVFRLTHNHFLPNLNSSGY
ncbi:3',5'-cyclic-AMP phosphodiesterase [Aliivibrio kagoshimensis]|uniref:3',5'-cyclic-AMP phosphodiesterase n=1 Tax=Aliivibrio kagoshimensis TaxID=2910230 RepID=UPI003D0F421B